ncbi:MAG: peptidylprolyl isomerase [Phycisphaeraceae bacterium]|nr:peptidylprolyl isomerase [Phycisphaeraceae bacterium]
MPRGVASVSGGVCEVPMLERLEDRLVLAAVDGLPLAAMLEVPTNPVVVFETNFGKIYIELFPQDAPTTVANFLNYVQRGLYSETMFHRSVPGFVLQGGGYEYTDSDGFRRVFDETLGPIVNEFGRPNIARTIAMAKFGNNPNSATSEFFFNLSDNSGPPASLDTVNGGFTVFGKVLTEDSWTTVQTIVGQNIENLTTDPAFQGQLHDRFGRPLFRQQNGFSTLIDTGTIDTGNGAMGEVPVRTSFDGTFAEADQIRIFNAQIVKPQGSFDYYEQVVAYPEGYASFSSRMEIDLANPNDHTVTVQIIARYEYGLRDRVLFTGTMTANSTRTILLHDTTNFDTSLLRRATPVAFEVYTSHSSTQGEGEAVGVSLNHFDFGGAISESGVEFTDFMQRSDTWDFAAIPFDAGKRAFLVWQNTEATSVSVTVTFFVSGQTPFTRTFDLGGYRRGGVDLGSIAQLSALPAGTLISARVTANDPIVVAMSSYAVSGAPGAALPVVGTLGIPDGGATRGVFGSVTVANSGTTTLAALNGSGSAAVTTLQATRSNGQVFEIVPAQFILAAQSRGQANLSSLFPQIPLGESFTLRYFSTTAISMHVFMVDASASVREGGMYGASTRVGTSAIFADGFQDFTGGGNSNERLGIYNPFANQSITVVVDYIFSDGAVITTQQTIAALRRVEIISSNVTGLIAKVSSGSQFRNYSIVVRGFDGGMNQERHLVADLLRFDTRNTGAFDQVVASAPVYVGPLLPLTSDVFTGGSGT